jgi:hypothetical protein
MVNIHSAPLTFTHGLVTAASFRLLPACDPAPAHSLLRNVPRGPLLRGGLTPFSALTTSCASPKASPQLSLFARWAVLAVWTLRCWSLGPSRRYCREPFPGCLDPYPGSLSDASTRFFSLSVGLPATVTRSAVWRKPVRRLQYGPFFRGLQSFLYVQASRFACHPGRSYRWRFRVQGSCDFYFRAPCVSLPSCTSDMLAV